VWYIHPSESMYVVPVLNYICQYLFF
jgi:hypothetical protein